MGGIEEKYESVRSRLDAFGYKAPLGVESIPLVERLFADLVHTTESLKKSRLKPSKIMIDKTIPLEETIEPFRQDNSRLMVENNDLHKNISFLREKMVETAGNQQQKARKIQNENSDLRFLNSQYLTKIKQMEKESFSKSEKIRKLTEKNMAAIVTSPGGTKKSAAPRRQRITIDHTIPFSQYKTPPLPGATDLFIADVLKIAEERCLYLEAETEKMKSSKREAEDRVKYVRKQKEICEGENERLRRQLSGGRPEAAITIETASKQTEKIITTLNLQLEIAQESQMEAEESAERFRLEIESFKSKNEKLKSELNEIGQMATVLEQERQFAVTKADKNSSLVDKEMYARKIRDLEAELEDFAKLLGKERGLKDSLERKLCNLTPVENIVELQKERDFYQEAYRKISERTGINDEIVSQDQVTTLIEERNQARNSILTLERKLEESIANLKVVQQERDRCEIRFGDINDQLASLRQDVIQSPLPSGAKNSAQGAILKRLQTERDCAMADLRRISCERDSLLEQVKINRENKMCDTVTLEQKVEDLEGRSRLLENERRDLLLTKSDQKSQIEALQNELNLINSNYENEKTELHQLKIELDEMRILRCQSEQVQRNGSQNNLKLRSLYEAEKEKSEALEIRVEMLVTNNNDLNDEISRLNATITALDREKESLTMNLDDKCERLAELEILVKQGEIASGESRHSISKLNQEIELLQDQIDDLEKKESTNTKLIDQKRGIESELITSRERASKDKRELEEKVALLANENNHLAKELEMAINQRNQTSNSVKENSDQILSLETELTQARRKLAQLSEQIIEYEGEQFNLNNELTTVMQENEITNKERTHLDIERVQVTERNLELENEIVEHIQVVQHHEKQIVEMSSHIRNLEEYLSRSRQEMSALTAALDGARELNSKLQSTADQSTREIALQINQSQNQETASEELRQEIGQLLNRLNQSEEAIFTLESAIRKLREENFEKEVLQTELSADREILYEKVKLSQNQFHQSDAELMELRSRLADDENTKESLRRQITDLKFQLERSNQKLKRIQNNQNLTA